MSLDQAKAITSEHYTNYVIVVLDEDTGLVEYRYNNNKIGKMLLNEALSDMKNYEDDVDWVWEDADSEDEEEE
jgi:uracil phosphoribosyltransferase